MREIKFRVYDIKYKTHEDFYMVDLAEYDLLMIGDKEVRCDSIFYQDRYIIVQYINLKDKNGKEIYENDLVKVDEDVLFIAWIERFASFGLTKKGWLHAHFFTEAVENEEVEVIGNIYENPELIE